MQDSMIKKFEEAFDKIEKDPSLLNLGRHGLEEYKRDGCLPNHYIKLWEFVLNLPITEMRNVVLSDTGIGEDLRKTSVFTKLTSSVK